MDVSFSGSEIAVITGILSAVIAALSFIFKLLIQEREKYNAFLELSLSKANDRNDKLDANNDAILTALARQTKTIEELVVTIRATLDGLKEHTK